MGWEELQNRLAEAFTTRGVIGNRVGYVVEHEKEYGAFVERTYRGHSILSHAFQEFYMDTIEGAASVWQEKERKPTPPTYPEALLWHLGNFKSVRAIDILFHNGYPMDGFARLRYLKESALFLGAMLAGITTYSKLKGWDGVIKPGKDVTPEDMNRIRSRRKEEEKRVLGLMLRRASGFAPEELSHLERWENVFHEEVHGAFLTLCFEHGPAAKGEDTTSVAPKPRERSCAMFINRFAEVAWMLHRTLPVMQLSDRRFGPKWDEKWRLLDENFVTVEQQLGEMGKNIGTVFVRFMQTKFPFGPETCFDTHVKN